MTTRNTETEIPETRVRKDPKGGWLIEARMSQGKGVYKWEIKGWTAGTRRDAERVEQEIIEDMKAEAQP